MTTEKKVARRKLSLLELGSELALEGGAGELWRCSRRVEPTAEPVNNSV